MNIKNTNVLVSGVNLDLKDPCAICLTGTGRNTIFCGGCLLWAHKKFSVIMGPFRPTLS